VDTACNSIGYAVDAFLNSTIVKNADPHNCIINIYPPLMSGSYYQSPVIKLYLCMALMLLLHVP